MYIHIFFLFVNILYIHIRITCHICTGVVSVEAALRHLRWLFAWQVFPSFFPIHTVGHVLNLIIATFPIACREYWFEILLRKKVQTTTFKTHSWGVGTMTGHHAGRRGVSAHPIVSLGSGAITVAAVLRVSWFHFICVRNTQLNESPFKSWNGATWMVSLCQQLETRFHQSKTASLSVHMCNEEFWFVHWYLHMSENVYAWLMGCSAWGGRWRKAAVTTAFLCLVSLGIKFQVRVFGSCSWRHYAIPLSTVIVASWICSRATLPPWTCAHVRVCECWSQ